MATDNNELRAKEEWQQLQKEWVQMFNEFAKAVSRVGGICSNKKMELNPVRLKLAEIEKIIDSIFTKQHPLKAEDIIDVPSSEHGFALQVYKEFDALQRTSSHKLPNGKLMLASIVSGADMIKKVVGISNT